MRSRPSWTCICAPRKPPKRPKAIGATGKSAKTLQTEQGPVPIAVPRDRLSTFEPRLVKKYQTRIAGLDDKILALYARGLSTRDIQAHLEELYATDISPVLISNVTEAVREEVLGLWLESNEGAKFWLRVLSELRTRGLEDVLFACCDGLKGFPRAIEASFPHAVAQTCIVHQVRYSLSFVSYADRKDVAVAKPLQNER